MLAYQRKKDHSRSLAVVNKGFQFAIVATAVTAVPMEVDGKKTTKMVITEIPIGTGFTECDVAEQVLRGIIHPFNDEWEEIKNHG